MKIICDCGETAFETQGREKPPEPGWRHTNLWIELDEKMPGYSLMCKCGREVLLVSIRDAAIVAAGEGEKVKP